MTSPEAMGVERMIAKLNEREGFMREVGHNDDAELDDEAAAIIQRLTEENEALNRQVNAYAYQRDCAREERDKAERRSENFWKPQKESAEARIKALEEDMERIADIAERNYGRQNEKLADIAPIARRALATESQSK